MHRLDMHLFLSDTLVGYDFIAVPGPLLFIIGICIAIYIYIYICIYMYISVNIEHIYFIDILYVS